jgi:hypothetical protein
VSFRLGRDLTLRKERLPCLSGVAATGVEVGRFTTASFRNGERKLPEG